MFIVDNIDLALSIIDAGFSVVTLQEDSDAFFSPDGLMEYLNSIAFLETCRMDYMYVLPALRKKQMTHWRNSLRRNTSIIGKTYALAGGEVIRSYLATSLPDPQEQQMFWEYAGYCMTTDTQMQKFLMLTGNGGTGKTILIDLVQKLVGIENCSNIPIQDLNQRFYATGMFGKLLNACGIALYEAVSVAVHAET